MKSHVASTAIGAAAAVAAAMISTNRVQAFHPMGGWWSRPHHQQYQLKKGNSAGNSEAAVPTNSLFRQLDLALHRSTTPATRRRRSGELHASADPSAPRKKRNSGKRRKVAVKQAVEQWSAESLELHRFNHKRVHVCKATTLPDVLSEFWSLTAECAQAKYKAMEDDRDYAAHVLFVVAQCDLVKDYGMMRHLDKVIDFCSGGCADFGRTVTLQHYHPDFVLPPSQSAKKPTRSRSDHDATTAHPNDLARVVNFSRSPFPSFGLTVASGSASRMDPIEAGDKSGRFRLDLEMLYNSVSGCSTEDTVDAHGSEHGTIPSDPETVMDKTQKWLSDCAEEFEDFKDAEDEERGYGRFLSSTGDFVTTSLSTPEEMFSEVWSIVAELQAKVALNPSDAGDTVGVPGNDKASRETEPLESTLLVAPRLHPFNAALFENLARNLGIALKQTPIMDRIEVEVYHPEYVCDSGAVSLVRRSPFPTLLIKHCGLKDELFEPSGMYRHSVPPLQIPVEALEAAVPADEADEHSEDGESGTANEVSADDAQP